MNVRSLKDFPKICSDPMSKLVFYTDETGGVILVYEASRDFLSTPKAFIEIRAQLDDDGVLCTGGALLSDEQHEQIKHLNYGCYFLAGGFDSMGKAGHTDGEPADNVIEIDRHIQSLPRHYIFYSPSLTVEFFSQDVALHHTHYHYTSAKTVLAQILNNLDGQ